MTGPTRDDAAAVVTGDQVSQAPAGTRAGWRLRTPMPEHAELIASWSSSVEEAGRWASRAEHPFPASAVTAWWEGADVAPWLLLDPDGVPVGYGELWDDPDEDEVELARLIVDPHRRRQGIGRHLVDALLTATHHLRRGHCFLRVAPDNAAALGLYRSAGFCDVDPTSAAEWNRQQPVDYVWLEHPTLSAR